MTALLGVARRNALAVFVNFRRSSFVHDLAGAECARLPRRNALGLLGMTKSTRSAGMAVIRMAAVAISPASACLVSALSVDSSDGAGVDRHGCYFLG